MAFNFLLRAWALIPKWLLVGVVACFVCYYTGISHGRAPNKLANKIQETKVNIGDKNLSEKEKTIKRKGAKANEAITDFECVIGPGVADWLSNISSH